jgi:hypothetical protein
VRASLKADVLPALAEFNAALDAGDNDITTASDCSDAPSTPSLTEPIFVCPITQRIMQEPVLAADG